MCDAKASFQQVKNWTYVMSLNCDQAYGETHSMILYYCNVINADCNKIWRPRLQDSVAKNSLESAEFYKLTSIFEPIYCLVL